MRMRMDEEEGWRSDVLRVPMTGQRVSVPCQVRPNGDKDAGQRQANTGDDKDDMMTDGDKDDRR